MNAEAARPFSVLAMIAEQRGWKLRLAAKHPPLDTHGRTLSQDHSKLTRLILSRPPPKSDIGADLDVYHGSIDGAADAVFEILAEEGVFKR